MYTNLHRNINGILVAVGLLEPSTAQLEVWSFPKEQLNKGGKVL